MEISTALKRNLKAGKEYDKLIPRVKCESTPLGEGDTFLTVDLMKNWIDKFRYQTVKIAPLFTGRSLEETVNNIYQFLYDHVQYTADGALQQLRSPACTWAQRKQGVDCKSYSVFASSILSNLGIKHYIRQIRQPYFYPEEFTHVYVVVPVNQDAESYLPNAETFVLDATKHENTESNYIEKVDLPMVNLKHVGLNAPQDERTQQIIGNFEAFCQHLLENGISLQTVNAIRSRIDQFTSQGKDPKFQIAPTGVVIEGVLFPLKFTPQPPERGLHGWFDTVVSTVSGKGSSDSTSSGTTQNSGSGKDALADAAASSGNPYAAAGAALLKMLPTDFIANTFGAVFANGFDLSCWNASYSESKATEALQVDIPYLINEYSGVSKNPTTENLNKFLNGIGGYISDSIHGQQSKYASCTRKGYALRQKGAEEARDQVLSTLRSSGLVLTPTGSRPGHIRTTAMPSYPEGTVYEWGQTAEYAYTYDSYSIGAPKSNGGTTETTTGGGTSNANTGLIVGGIALATLPFLFMKNKPGIAPMKPRTKKPAIKKPAPRKRATTKRKTASKK